MGVHDIQRHLHRVEMEIIFRGRLEHPKVNEWILVSGETDVADFTGLASLQHGFLSSALAKNSVRIVRSNYFMMLEQVDVVGLKSFQ